MNRLANIKTPVIFAHRGASAHAPENTMAAFTLAKEHGADAVELDVKITKDNQAVIIHDPTIDRTTDGAGYVHKINLDELKEYDAGASFAPIFSGEKIPALAELFETVGKDLFFNIELTNYLTPFDSLPSIVADLVKKFQQENNVLFSSFSPLTLVRIKRLLPHVPAAILASPGAAGSFSRSIFGRWISPDIIHPHVLDSTPAFIAKQRRINRRVHVWTVNQEKEISNLFRHDIDGIFTDDPRLAVELRKPQ